MENLSRSHPLDVMELRAKARSPLDAHRMVDLLKEMPPQEMTFEIDDNTFETMIV